MMRPNHPDLWREYIKPKTKDSHKYDYGHAVIYGGPLMTGAASLAAQACMRIGAGLCTIVGDEKNSVIFRREQPHIMFEPCENVRDFSSHLIDERRNAVLIGPGAGLDDKEGLRQAVKDVCGRTDKICVLDADALSVFEGCGEELYEVTGAHCILTPHEGEFVKIFPELGGEREVRAKKAAKISGATILLKGVETVIAHPDGRIVINKNASPDLATAGSGDVLAGIILGLLARGVPPFEAACAGAWLHGEAGLLSGPGLVAPDIINKISHIL